MKNTTRKWWFSKQEKNKDTSNIEDGADTEKNKGNGTFHSLLGIQQPKRSKTLVKDVPGTYPLLEDTHTGTKTNESTGGEGPKEDEEEEEDEEIHNALKTKSGIILHPQPTQDKNDPLNWPIWKRDMALIVVGVHCFVGGGQTSMLAAGTTRLSQELHVSLTKISYLVGLMMVALALGSLIASPTARIIGKRSVYLMGIVVFFFGSIGCALSTDYAGLLVSRIISGFGVSTVESLPSATIAEIYFAHERAYRFGIYTLLLLGGKNLVPLFGSLVFENLNRHWLFWIVAIIVGINFILHILFVPETFWNRTPVPNKRSIKESNFAREQGYKPPPIDDDMELDENGNLKFNSSIIIDPQFLNNIKAKVHFTSQTKINKPIEDSPHLNIHDSNEEAIADDDDDEEEEEEDEYDTFANSTSTEIHSPKQLYEGKQLDVPELHLHETNNTYTNPERRGSMANSVFTQNLSLYNGRHSKDKWRHIFVRPLILYAYPHVLFSSFLYSFSVVWLIVISEVIAHIFISDTYHFSSLTTGLIYISPFVGGCLGSLCAGTISDFVVRYMSKKNHGFYEPEFRLFMCIPAVLATTIGLFSFGWSSQVHDFWFVPTFFFGLLAFGCSLASTTAITLSVDSYKGFSQEALVTFNVTKNLLGFFFSLFNNIFVDKCGLKTAFVVYGCIELALGLMSIPLYIYGKRIRQWTEEAKLMDFSYKKED